MLIEGWIFSGWKLEIGFFALDRIWRGIPKQRSIIMKKIVLTMLLAMPLTLYSVSSVAFDVGGFVNGVIEGVSDSFKEAKGKPGAHEKGKQQEQGKSAESDSAEESAASAAEDK
ncbi:hypothetical protein A3195_08600 [Candidatus Thiodiazotropha endoloripes]|uniref:Uncharacterized protein n=2 Tax=Candidatus Thiodiazotropha endoloripes TaxID=1818881 RepID=A0A1E2UMT4_9GAMM|nr:hypothetical protein A3195_08600 [Candidatus Thiodiazotropha endoloripes]ODB95875.1 hypothetical protein A3196_03335 [Candidatus Thiodiazotropha endoloripes]